MDRLQTTVFIIGLSLFVFFAVLDYFGLFPSFGGWKPVILAFGLVMLLFALYRVTRVWWLPALFAIDFFLLEAEPLLSEFLKKDVGGGAAVAFMLFRLLFEAGMFIISIVVVVMCIRAVKRNLQN